LQRRHIIAADFKYCGKEIKRKLEQGPVEHEMDFKVKVYTNRRVTADSETLLALGDFSEREIHTGTGLSRRIIRHIRHDGQVKPSTMQRITDFLARTIKSAGRGRATEKLKAQNPG
jgi:hypothetical protein